MRIVFLVDRATAARRGAAHVLLDASDLARRGHEVTVLSELAPPPDHDLACDHVVVDDLRQVIVPSGDLIVASSRPTAELAVAAGVSPAVAELDAPSGPQPDRPPCWVAAVTERRRPAGTRHALPPAVDPVSFHPPTVPGSVDVVARVGGCCTASARVTALSAALAESGTPAVPVVIEPVEPGDAETHRALTARELGDLLRSLDVFVVPEESAGAEQLVLEAMACGVPCVLADVPRLRARIGDRRGAALLVEDDDPVMWTESVGLVLRHRGLREQLAEAGIEVAGGHSRARRVDELERALALIAARAQRAAPARPIPTPPHADHATHHSELVHALAARAEALLLAGRLEEAAGCLEAALAVVPDSVLLWTQLGETRLRNGDPEGAVSALDRARAEGGHVLPAARDARRRLPGPVPAGRSRSRARPRDPL